jgi:hypothetical protein
MHKQGMPDFTQLILPIQSYLAHAPASPERAAAVDAYNVIIDVIYGPEAEMKRICPDGVPRMGNPGR